ncbi:PREDICTED: UNC93-like protein MFSD11 isoform X2 [Priapulus caudatus]|uniref:UNC93-like protein MFSD11 n=1 Tax=Priapulus caudatus TaxID=37621 RepID=A0ABM1F8W5_PRICU|nr:PREDICTED: UNC93-like protein MFSD11 isoform X2 [Priapulus caudatus]
MMENKTLNVVLLGFAFMLIFTAFQTCTMVEKTVLEGTGVDGYVSLAILYAVFAASNWAAPSIISVTGPKYAMVFGGVVYCIFIGLFLKPSTYSIYGGSAVLGIAAAVLWTAQGSYLTINSDSETISRNSGIFWALLQCSLLFGNLYAYFKFHGEIHIDDSSRNTLFTVLLVTCCVGLLLLLLLRNRRGIDNEDLLSINATRPVPNRPMQALKRSLELLRTREMLFLSVCFAYTGLELTFFSGVYGTSVGHTLQFGESAKQLLGLSGVFIGIGEILGGATFGLFGKRTNRYGRDPIVMFGCVIHMICFFLIYINLPGESPLQDTQALSVITPPNLYLAIVCSFLLGLGDSSFNTQIYSILGMMFPEDSAPAFALFKFVQSLAAAAAFYYSGFLYLPVQLVILVIMAILGTFHYYKVRNALDLTRGYALLSKY